MATAPSITSITFDKASYNPGDTITATVDYTPGTSPSTQSFVGTGTDSVSGLTGQLSVTFVVIEPDATTVKVADSGNRTWTKVSDSGGVAKFTAIA